jgi:hypothetical protein
MGHVDAGAAPVRLAHEAVDGRVGAHRHHQHVRHFAARHRHLRQVAGAVQFLGALGLRGEQGLEAVVAVGFYQL